jgi:hypothetical protein
MTHLAGVADRIDRSISPCGGREERELEIVVKEALEKETATPGDYCTRRGPCNSCIDSMIRFPL